MPVKTVKGQVQMSNGVRLIPGRILGTKGGDFTLAKKPANALTLTLAGASAPKADGGDISKEYVTTQVKIQAAGEFPPACQFEPDPNRTILSQRLRLAFVWPGNATKGDEATIEYPTYDTAAIRRNSTEGKECSTGAK